MVNFFARLSIIAALIMAGPPGEGAVPLSPDLAIREAGNVVQLFVVDPHRRMLFFGERPRESATPVPVASLTPGTPCGMIDQAVAVAIRGSRLVVVKGDPEPSVLECNLESGQTRVVHRGEPLRLPGSVALAADGTIAVLDRVLRAVVVLRPDAKATVVRVSPAPTIIRSDDLGQLYVLDQEMRGIVPVQLTEGKLSSLGSSPQQQSRGGALLPLTVEPAAFAIYRDVFYVAETVGPLRVQLAGGRLSIEVPDVRPRQAAVAVSRDKLAMIDREGAVVEMIDRPLPAGVVLDPTRGNPNEAWLQLLEYIADRRLLARDRVKLTADDTTYESVLTRAGVLLKSDVSPQKLALPPGRANRLFCVVNPGLCKQGYSAQLDVVVIPEASPQSVLQTETTVLDGKGDVRSWVNQHVLLASHQKEVTDAYLTTRNPSSITATLENELLRRKMVMATPMDTRLVAGSLIRIENGREVVIGEIGSMCEGVTAATAKTSVMSRLQAPRAVVPDPRFPAAAARATMEVGAWLRSTISTSALEKCQPREMPPDTYVITESLAVMGTTFAPAPPATGLFVSAVQNEPLYVGYKVVPMSGLYSGVAIPTEPERVKPVSAAAPSGIWTLSSGSVTLPVTRWRADVLLPAPDFYAANGALRRLRLQQPAIDLSPRERLDRAALSSHTGVVEIQDGDVAAKVQTSQKLLLDTIQYNAKLAAEAGTEDVFIGVVEDPASVNRDHPGFVSDDLSAWFDYIDGAGALQPHRAQSGTASLTLRRADKSADHGTHVAGTIAARQPASLGLLPKTRLFLIPNDSMSELKRWIQTARDNFVYIFNISQGFGAATPPDDIQDLHGRMKESWKDALFVVAAGNEGADLNAVGALPPVAWSDTLPNVLTVAASDALGENILGQHRDGQDEVERKGSNFGSRFVDLVAPGQTIHSFSKDGYAYACGTSHAAPQVTATAAMLWAQSTKPEVVRARLIYTADWKDPNFDDKVWGGLLNVKRAVFKPRSNVFIRAGADTTPQEIKLVPNATVHIEGDVLQRNGNTTSFREVNFPFSRVLRIEPLGAGRSRIVLLSNPGGVLTIVKGTIQGSVKCLSVKRYDENTQLFSREADPPVNCQQGVSVGGLQDYVAAMPAAVKFQ